MWCMFSKTFSFARAMGCCGCFGFARTPESPTPIYGRGSGLSRELLIGREDEEEEEEDEEEMDDGDDDNRSDNSDVENNHQEDESLSCAKRSEEILKYRLQNGLICRDFPVKETVQLVRSEDDSGNKMINEYVWVSKIGFGSYGKVILYRSSIDGKYYAVKAFHKSHLIKQRVAPSETAMNDVLREVMIMKVLQHPNIVNLVEVIDDPDTDHFYMVLEYVGGRWDYEPTGPAGAIGEITARKYLRNIVSGLMYLHAHNIVHGDIKPDNLLVTLDGKVKIADFSVSQVFQDNNDELRRSPGTPVFTAPECVLGVTYNGKAADTWAVGVTLYCMILGTYPFIGDTLQETYDKIASNPLRLPNRMNPLLRNLLEGLLTKEPILRMTLKDVAEHPWVIGNEGPISEYQCWCKRSCKESKSEDVAATD